MTLLNQIALSPALLANKNWPVARRLREERYLAAPAAAKKNLVFVYYPHRIPESQLYPFHRYRKELKRDWGLRPTHVSLDHLDRLERAAKRPLEGVEIVCLQTWFDWSKSDVQALYDRLERIYPRARFVYYDWFATTDLRMAAIVDPFVDAYVKKNRFVRFGDYERSHHGDTNLTDYYGRLYGIADPEKHWELPPGFEEKLLTGDSFITGPVMEPLLSDWGERILDGDRPIQLHARLGGSGEGWYGHMRDDARRRVVDLGLERVAYEGMVGFREYLSEIAASKLTFSPFGYGEICWRDFEAMALGSLLIKPDVSHLDDRHRLFIPHETYVPLAWDFSDLKETVERYLNDDRERSRITHNAFEAARRYYREKAFLEHVSETFHSPRVPLRSWPPSRR